MVYMIIALSNTSTSDPFGGVLLAVLAFNLVVLFTLTFAPQVHNRIRDWVFNNLLDGSGNGHK